MIHQLAQLTGVDVNVCREATLAVAARYRGLIPLEHIAADLLKELQAGHERYMIVRYFREEVCKVMQK